MFYDVQHLWTNFPKQPANIWHESESEGPVIRVDVGERNQF